MPGIYISYRRQDSGAHAKRLYEALSGDLGVRVAMDETVFAAGVDFAEGIEAALRASDALVVVIGRDWVNASDASGRRRLDDPNDSIRIEVASALGRGLPVIPVLVDAASMPLAEDLPDELKPLAMRAAIELTDAHWRHDLARLEQTLSRLTGAAPATAAPATAAPRAAPSVLQQGWGNLRRLLRREEPVGATAENMAREHAGAEPAPDIPMDGAEPETALPGPDPSPPATPAPVHLGASAPRAVKPGDEFTARFLAYAAERESALRDTLARLSPRNESHLGLKTCQWRPGGRFTVCLAAKGLEISPAEENFEWDGGQAMVEFDVIVPEATPLGVVVLKFDVLMDGIVVARLRLDLEIAAQAATEPAEANGGAARTAFASYSSKDRQRVLDRIDAVRIAAGLDVFLDCLSLHPGESWKTRLDREIPARDLFMLFWSADAARSEWVEWEWRQALALKGLDAMQIHPLENGVKPPPELGALHFGSVAMYARAPDGS